MARESPDTRSLVNISKMADAIDMASDINEIDLIANPNKSMQVTQNMQRLG